jgi:hypothetical protein
MTDTQETVTSAPGPEVQLAPCPVEGHDAEHFQVRTHEHWMCGHLLADALAANGIPPVLAGDRDRLADELEQARAQIRNYSGNQVTYLSVIGQVAAALLEIADGCADPLAVARKALHDTDEVKRLEAEMTALRAERDEACRGVAEMSGAFDPDRPGIPLERVEHWRMFAASHPDGDGDAVTMADVIAETVPFAPVRAELLQRAGMEAGQLITPVPDKPVRLGVTGECPRCDSLRRQCSELAGQYDAAASAWQRANAENARLRGERDEIPAVIRDIRTHIADAELEVDEELQASWWERAGIGES